MEGFRRCYENNMAINSGHRLFFPALCSLILEKLQYHSKQRVLQLYVFLVNSCDSFFFLNKSSVIDQSTGLNVVLSLAFPNESNVV